MQPWQDGTPQDQTDPQEWGGRFAPPARGARLDADIPSGVIPLAYRLQEEPQNIKPAARPFFCADCGGREFWQLPGGRWMCSSCRPQPKAYARPEPITATTPAAEPITAQAMPQAPEPAAIQANPPKKGKPAKHKAGIKTVEIWPLMGIRSQDENHAGAWRLSVLFSALDHNAGCNHVMGICKGGSGKIERARLQSEALSQGVKRSTFFVWLADARKTGIFSGEGKYLYLASQEKIAQIFACNAIDEHKATIPIKLLFKAGWKSIVWAAYIKANHASQAGVTNKLKKVYRGDVVSRRKLEDITGIQPRKQRRLNAFVKSTKNIAITNTPGTWETAAALNMAAKDHGVDRNYFIFNDPEQIDPAGKKNYARVIAHTLPSRHTVQDSNAAMGARGHRRQILAAIKRLRLVQFCNYSILSLLARPRQATVTTANSETFNRYPRVYHETKAQKKRCPLQRDNVFILRKSSPKAGIFEAVFAA